MVYSFYQQVWLVGSGRWLAVIGCLVGSGAWWLFGGGRWWVLSGGWWFVVSHLAVDRS